MTQLDQHPNETKDIAITGIASFLPKSDSLETLWKNLKTNTSCLSPLFKSKRHLSKLMLPYKNTPLFPKKIGLISHAEDFDPQFFNISPREATLMDPQQRKSLELAWMAIENAGYNPKALSNQQIGVYWGYHSDDYKELALSQKTTIDHLMTTSLTPYMIANRISSTLNITGPSETINTACSSSLVALHQAVQALRHNHCSQALVGGINLILSQTLFLSAFESRLLSPTDACRPLDITADGFVRSEGGAALLLKPLDMALKNHDHIYAIIKGTGTQHTGLKANTIKGPTNLIKNVLKQSQISPKSIHYVEPHSVGHLQEDLIELDTINTLFNKPKVGSIKASLGHTEATSGLTGLIHTIVQLSHQEFLGIPSLKTPQKTTEKETYSIPKKGSSWTSKQQKRRACINAFGLGGSLATAIIEEPPKPPHFKKTSSEELIVLSAPSINQLKDYADHLYKTLSSPQNKPSETPHTLKNIAYTLNVGRPPFPTRLAIIAATIPQLNKHLYDFIKHKKPHENMSYTTTAIKTSSTSSLYNTKKGKSLITEALKSADNHLLAQLWMTGIDIDWTTLYTKKNTPYRIPLPTYPFDRKRYWIDTLATTAPPDTDSRIHPFIEKNTSTLEKQQFELTLHGHEPYLTEHVIFGQKTLPGSIQLEMARAAGLLASEQPITEIQNIQWSTRFQITNKPKKVTIELTPSRNKIHFNIKGELSPHHTINLSKGTLIQHKNTYALKQIPIKTIKNRCPIKLNKKTCYNAMKKVQLTYGLPFQGIQTLYYGEQNDYDELLVVLSTSIRTPVNKNIILNPYLIDTALHATLGFELAKIGYIRTVLLPTALNQLVIISPESNIHYIYITTSKNDQKTAAQTYTLSLLNKEGVPCLFLNEFSVTPYTEQNAPLKHQIKPHTYIPKWTTHHLSAPSTSTGRIDITAFIGGYNSDIIDTIKQTFKHIHVYKLPQSSNKSTCAKDSFITIFKWLKEQLKNPPKTPKYLVIVAPLNKASIAYSHLSGLLKTVQLENRIIKGKLLLIKPRTKSAIITCIRNDLVISSFSHTDVRYLDITSRETKQLQEIPAISPQTPDKRKRDLVYWIAGGTGELGLILTTYLSKINHVTLILSNRSKLNDRLNLILDKLQHHNNTIRYIPCDFSKKKDVSTTFKSILSTYGKINGIIYSAGVTRDGLIINKSVNDITAVFNSKIDGVLNLDAVTKHEKLDFFILFSSISSIIGNPGQSDYSAANTFLDLFSENRNQLIKKGKRHGKTTSINWPLWEKGGMMSKKESQSELTKRTGLVPLPSKTALQLFELSQQIRASQLIIFNGDKQTISDKLMPPISTQPQASERPLNKVIENLKTILSTQLNIPIQDVHTETPLENYGIKSLLIKELTHQLEKLYDTVPSTLFFENKTISSLAKSLLTYNTQQLPTTVQKDSHDHIRSTLPRAHFTNNNEKTNQAIAIIGISGQYPKANTLQDFWKNLFENKNCITEIPLDRFDYRTMFHPKKGTPHTIYCKWGGFLDDIDKFDNAFFNIAPQTARMMDPQERLFMKCAWECLEQAGYITPHWQHSPRKVGVFAGVTYNNYQLIQAELETRQQPQGFVTNSQLFSIANRTSYFFNFMGPSITLDTACSSSLYAIHMACESIKRGESDMAIAGGVNLSLHPSKYQTLCFFEFAGSTPHCHSFSDGGDGYIPSEGVGTILLKPYENALKDNDQILAIIKGTGVSHDGKTNGYSVPSPTAQTAAIETALKQAQINPETINYIEAHGTGTPLGDPIEIKGLQDAFSQYTSKKQFCAIGSIKSLVGHCEAASGICSLTKTILQLQHKTLIASPLHGILNPRIDFQNSPFYVQEKNGPWDNLSTEHKTLPLRAGISSFGAGGVNVHIILEEHQSIKKVPSPNTHINKSSTIIYLSTHVNDRLVTMAQNLLNYCQKTPNNNSHDIAYTLQTRRAELRYRLAFVVTDISELINSLKNYLNNTPSPDPYYFQNDSVKCNTTTSSTSTNTLLLDKKTAINNARLWTKGECRIPILTDQAHNNYTCLPLPSYPFISNSFWPPSKCEDKSTTHPPLSTSLSQQKKHTTDTPDILTQLETWLKTILGTSSNNTIDINTPFLDLGLDSVSAKTFSEKITSRLGAPCSELEIFSYPTLKKMTAYLESELEKKDSSVPLILKQ